MKKHVFTCLILFMLAPFHSVFAALLLPLDVNDLYISKKHDSANPANEWTTSTQGLDRVEIGGQQYVKAGTWNSHGDGNYDEFLFRSTETAVYGADGSMIWQIGPIGTTWSFSSYWADTALSGSIVNEIISIESVTVPYGTFNNAYVTQAYFDFDDPSVGSVKQIDYTWSTNGPAIEELVQISRVPNSASIWLLGSGLIGLIGLAKLKRD